MSRVYATREDDGRRVLVEIACDHPGCPATVRPHADIAKSGWTKRGTYEDTYRGTTVVQWDFCPDHEHSQEVR